VSSSATRKPMVIDLTCDSTMLGFPGKR
jgi:hypothetical protein